MSACTSIDRILQSDRTGIGRGIGIGIGQRLLITTTCAKAGRSGSVKTNSNRRNIGPSDPRNALIGAFLSIFFGITRRRPAGLQANCFCSRQESGLMNKRFLPVVAGLVLIGSPLGAQQYQ